MVGCSGDTTIFERGLDTKSPGPSYDVPFRKCHRDPRGPMWEGFLWDSRPHCVHTSKRKIKGVFSPVVIGGVEVVERCCSVHKKKKSVIILIVISLVVDTNTQELPCEAFPPHHPRELIHHHSCFPSVRSQPPTLRPTVTPASLEQELSR